MKLAILGGFVLGLALAVGAVFFIDWSGGPVKSQKAQAQGRWYNVTYPTSVTAMVDGTEQTFLVYTRTDPNQPQSIILNIDYPKGDSGVVIDGSSAAILARGNPIDVTISSLVDSLVAGIEFSRFDSNTAPWPYRPDVGKNPNPMSGITKSSWIAEGRTGSLFENFRSRLIIWDDSPEGTIEYSCQVMDAADRGAFTRLVLANAAPGVAPEAVNYPEGVESCVLTGPPQ